MLLCVYQSVSYVWRCVCSCAHCANVCVALILVFPLTIPRLLPSFSLLTFDDHTLTHSKFQTKPCFIIHYFLFINICSQSTCPFPHLTTIHLSIHWSIHSLMSFGFLLPTFIYPATSFPLLPISDLSLFPFCSYLTLSTSFFSSLPPFLSLFHTVLCASLSLAGLLLGGWEFVCTQVPAEHPLHPGSQPGSASLLFILLLLLPFPSLPPSPYPHPSFLSASLHDFSCHLSAESTVWSPSPFYPLTFHCPFLPVGSIQLQGFSLVSPSSPSLVKNSSFSINNWLLCNYVKSQFLHPN